MKWLSIFLAVSLTASEKLDRTYLPPPGAQFAGGNPDEILAPLELPNLPQTGSIPVGYSLNSFKETIEPLIKSPITTTSYAFTQTTTFPSIESYATTPIPINPTIGLPVENLGLNNNLFYNQNLPSILQQDAYNVNILPGSLSQNQNQNIFPTEGDVLIPSSKFQQPILNLGFQQYPSEQLDKEKFSQYSDLNIGHPNPSQENFTPQGQNIEIHNQGVSTKSVPQSNTYPLHNLNTPLTPYNQDHQSYSNGGMPQKQFLPKVQTTLNPGQLGKTQFQELGQGHIDVPSTTSLISSKLPSSEIGSVKYFERPQAVNDRNAVILNYENVLTPNSYSYSYDTSNGIHADESGVVGDGTKAKGSYSYMGDDGKIYSIFYTADENGFQPHGDHLPTPPPIPEAIKRVIEQAAKDKEAGIIDDGSYDENKYGHKNYYNPISHRRPQGSNSENNKIGPTSGATSNVYNKNQTLSQFPEYHDIGNKNNLYENDYKDEKYKEDDSEAFSGLNKGNVIEGATSPDISGYINAIDFKNPQHSDTSENKNIEINQVNSSATQEQPRSGQAFPKDGFSDITNIMQDIKLSPVNNGLTVNNKFEENNIPNNYQEFINGNGNIDNNNQINSPDFTDESKYISDQPPKQEINQELDQNGYHYNHPENQKFTSRFKVENTSSTTEPKYVTFNKNTTPLPITPEVRIEPTNKIQYSNRKSTTPRPFMTSRVSTIPRGGPFSDYDSEDEQDIDEENITRNKLPSKIINNGARRPIQSSETVTPSIPTTSYFSRFGNTEIPQNNAISQEAQKLTSKSPESLNNFANTKTSNYMDQTTRPSFGTETTSAPYYSSHVEDKDSAYNPQIIKEYGPQEHLISTFKPASTTTQIPSVYQPDYFRPSPLHSTSNGYQYQPIRSGYNVRTKTPERLDAESNPNYYQRPVDYTGATNGPEIRYETTSPKYASTTVFSPQSQDSFINSGLPETHVSDAPFSGYVYGPPQIVYPTTASTIGNTPASVISSQPLQPNSISQVFSTTTQSPTHSSIQNTYDQNTVVDGFGRPIKSGTQLIVSSPDQKDIRFTGTQFSPKDDLKSFDGTSIGSSALPEGDRPTYTVEQSTRYPEYNNQGKVIGENFSGPKQPQRFDPQTGYHYK